LICIKPVTGSKHFRSPLPTIGANSTICVERALLFAAADPADKDAAAHYRKAAASIAERWRRYRDGTAHAILEPPGLTAWLAARFECQLTQYPNLNA
jgi:hypothetical protein